ncbi:MAG: OmpA family protein [Myxococcota bacterium]
MFVQHSMRWAALAAACLFGAVGCQSTGTESMVKQESQKTQPGPARADLEQPPAAPAGLEAIYFELDRSELSGDAQRALKANAKQIQALPEGGALTIEGHCDERGSDEYNMALGARRASSVKRYLMDLGVPGSRLDTVTYGESRPAVRGEGERVWRRNRRAEIHGGLHQASR